MCVHGGIPFPLSAPPMIVCVHSLAVEIGIGCGLVGFVVVALAMTVVCGRLRICERGVRREKKRSGCGFHCVIEELPELPSLNLCVGG